MSSVCDWQLNEFEPSTFTYSWEIFVFIFRWIGKIKRGWMNSFLHFEKGKTKVKNDIFINRIFEQKQK